MVKIKMKNGRKSGGKIDTNFGGMMVEKAVRKRKEKVDEIMVEK